MGSAGSLKADHCTFDLITRCIDRLLNKDADLKGFELMDSDMQGRERFFMANSVKGYVEFLQTAG